MTRRVVLKVNGQVYEPWTEVEIVRDLGEISGSFRLSYYDAGRAARALRPAASRGNLRQLNSGQACQLLIDDELVLVGWIDDVDLEWSPDHISASVTGRDKTGDLADCAATVDGPAEYRNVTLLEIAQAICRPFGIPVKSEVADSRRFDRFSIDVAETAMSALEKATRQAAVLLTSDGIGGLVLTRSGIGRAPEAIRMGTNISLARARFSWRQRFSDYIYKAQQERDGRTRGGAPALDHAASPLDAVPPGAARPVPAEAAGIIRTGRARDLEVTRYRPRVRLVRTESAGSSAQQQADFLMRTSRGQSEGLTYEAPDWRAGPTRRLWRPNELAAVIDPYADVDRDMLIGGVSYLYDDKGTRCELRVVGPEAFDRIQEDARRRRTDRIVQDTRPRDDGARRLPGDDGRRDR